MAQAAAIEYQGAVYILQALGITPTSVNVNLLCAQEINEWGWSGTLLAQSKNPLATTYYTPQAVGKWNSVPVWIFSTLQAGAQACAKTFTGGRGYPTLLQALRTSNASLYFGSAGRAELYTWSGGSASYANSLQNFYGELAPVPSAYLVTATPTKGTSGGGTTGTHTGTTTATHNGGPTVSSFLSKAAPYALLGVLGLGAAAAGAVALDEMGALPRLRIRRY